MNDHTERPTRLADGKTYCACGRRWPCPHADPTAPSAILARWREAERAATKGEWCAEPPTGAGRVWVQIGARRWADADLEPLFNYRTHREPVIEEERQRQFRQREADAAFIVTARTAMPRLLAAVEAALKLHRPVEYALRGGLGPSRYCAVCAGPPRWPCPEVRDITAALTGKESGGEH